MIKVNYIGRMGNNMFQYSFGRILAEELGMHLVSNPIPEFRATYQSVPGKSNNTDVLIVDDSNCKDILDKKESLVDKSLLLNGFFQQYTLYKPYKERLRQWFKPKKMIEKAKEADIVIHIRLGDYMSTLIPSHWALPAEYYLSCIEMSSAKNIHIVTDDPNHSFLNNFSKLNPKIINGNVIQDFTYLTSAKKIILSRSSFSFWVGFLSEAEEIYSPNPDKGLWADSRQDLFVDDEERYKLVSVEV